MAGSTRITLEHWSPPEKTGPPCSCKDESFQKVSEELRYHILTSFNLFPSTDAQNMYLHGLIVGRDTRQVGSQGRGGLFRGNNLVHRNNTFDYFVANERNRRIKVCQKDFLSTHGISQKRTRTAWKSPSQIPDNRGRHQNRPNKISTDLLNKVCILFSWNSSSLFKYEKKE